MGCILLEINFHKYSDQAQQNHNCFMSDWHNRAPRFYLYVELRIQAF